MSDRKTATGRNDGTAASPLRPATASRNAKQQGRSGKTSGDSALLTSAEKILIANLSGLR